MLRLLWSSVIRLLETAAVEFVAVVEFAEVVKLVAVPYVVVTEDPTIPITITPKSINNFEYDNCISIGRGISD
jgi:hypothetical protein